MKKIVVMALALLLVALVQPSFAGNIIITGHDTDDHTASLYMNWALTALLNNGDGTTLPVASQAGPKIGYIGNSSPNLGTYLGFYDNFMFYDLDLATWTNAFTDGNNALIIGSGADFVSSGGSTTLNANQTSFINYFNGGGNLFVNTEQGLGQSFYGFIPSFGGTLANNLPGCSTESGSGACMNVTAQGTARGHTIAQIVDASITHTRFTNLDPQFEVLSIYNNSGGAGTGSAITFALLGGSATGGGGGGFQGGNGVIPEPSTYLLLASGLGLLGFIRSRQKAA